MKRQATSLLLLFLSFLSIAASAQETLPKFSVRKAGNSRVIIGWVNPFPNVTQISIQRSFDSLNNYKTILSVADPKAVQNGFADTKAPNDHMFYRLFYSLEGGSYFFTKAKKPDTSKVVISPNQPKPTITINDFPKFNRDSIVIRNRDTFVIVNNDTVAIRRAKPLVVKKPEFVPSFYVYTNKDGYVYINLPDAEEKKYNLKFFDDTNAPLFEIKNIKEKGLILDKTNFYHAGWYFFELYNDEKLVERHKFFLKAF